jgi:hypothetical protein
MSPYRSNDSGELPPEGETVVARAKRLWREDLGAVHRRAKALDERVEDATGVKVASYRVPSAGGISLFPGLTDKASNGHAATAAQVVLRLDSPAGDPGSSDLNGPS